MGAGSSGSSRIPGAVWGEVLILKMFVKEMELSWKMFKRKYSVMVKSTDSGSRLLGFESMPFPLLVPQVTYLLNGIIIVCTS